MMCMSPSRVNLPYTLYFASFGVGGLLTFPLLDKLGRLRSHWVFSTLALLAQALIVFVPNYMAHTIGYALLGFLMAKQALCYTWAFDLLMKDHKSCALTFIHLLDFSTCAIGGLYFTMSDQPDWKSLIYPFFYLGLLGYLMCLLLLPESPKWLLL